MNAPAAPIYVDAATIRDRVSPADAVEAVLAGLRGDVDPAADVARSAVSLARGDLLLMPAQSTRSVGVKLAAVAPDNPGRGLPRISAAYVLFDADTLQVTHLLDGVELTNLRTPAVSVAAVKSWLDRIEAPLRVVVFGAGPQGVRHLETVADVHPVERATFVVRDPSRVEIGPEVLAADDPVVADRLRAAHLVICATTARTPVFDSCLLGERAIVVAVGSHEPEASEVDAAWCRRAVVVVEDRRTALRECGDVIQSVSAGSLAEDDLVELRAVARGERPAGDEAVFFKGSGMSWQDLVIAEAVLARI